jgi:general secretion pathway protein C
MTLLTNLFQNLTRHRDSLWRFAFIVVITFFSAKLVSLLIAHKYLPLELPQKLSSASSYTPSLSADEQVNIQAILSRNIFDSEARKRVVDRTVSTGGEIVPSTLPVELLGTIVFRNVKFSVALIRDRNSQKSEYYAVGQNLETATVVKIERFRVILDNGGRLESLELKAGQSTLTPKAFSPTPRGEIEDVNSNTKVIPQSVIDDVLANFGQVLTQARMIPNNTDDKKIDGFKIFQIKPDSIYEKLGLKDNDIIKRVNGQDLDNFEKATGLLTALRNEKTISIDIVRNGTKVNYTYEIH